MADVQPVVDLTAPFTVDTILEVRTSRMKKFPGLRGESGIDKKICPTEMKIDMVGLEGDEHDLTFHGGPDKAILGYCSSHYPSWKQSYPDRVDRFVPGGFGENFVTAHMNERNVCIGDIVAVGTGVLLQVSLPRNPCYKLNHRFSLKAFAPETVKSSRTGWYYRVLREGTVKAGDEVRLVERKWPKWTIERIQEYLHRNAQDDEMNAECAAIEEMGAESRDVFLGRVEKAKRKKEAQAQEGLWRDFELVSRNMETHTDTGPVVSLVFKAKQTDDFTEVQSLGSSAKIRLPNGLERSYSITGAGPDNANVVNQFELGVKLEEEGRGGSRWLHGANVGDKIRVGRVTQDIKFSGLTSSHHFIVGGIGITAFVAAIKALHQVNYTYKVHYAIQSQDHVPFRERLEPYEDDIIFYDKSKGQRMNVSDIVKSLPFNSHLYVCGPSRLMEATQAAVQEHGVAPEDVHYEAFKVDATGDPFEAVVKNKSGKVVAVAGEETLLEVLRREFDVPSSCEAGNCGTCKVKLCDGRVEHRGSALGDEEKKESMLSCVSRGIGRIAIEV